MREERGLFRSAASRLNQVIRESEQLHAIAKQQKEEFKPENMPEMRRLANSITQCIHEFNAYHTALTGGDDSPVIVPASPVRRSVRRRWNKSSERVQ